ncbi:MAG: hypothetical protein NTX00_03250 [Candidatus Parcubacteria bacterium]|nr:hypothetical protein [Candidatus Parcubacteria bacterium]
MEKKSFIWLATMIIGLTIAVWLTGCSGSGNGATPSTGLSPIDGVPPDPTDTTSIDVGISVDPGQVQQCPTGIICSKLVTPGVPPGTIKVCGTIENQQCWDAFATTPSCWVDRSGEVVGGQLHHSYTVPIETPLHMEYSLANQKRVDGITINGTALTSFGVLGTAPYQWVAACFIIHRDQAGVITVGTNTNCTAQVRQARLVYTGDTGGSGAIGSYTNSVYNTPYDDPMVPFNGTLEGPIKFQAGYWELPNPGTPPVWQTWVWNAALSAYTETFFSVATTQATYWTIFHPCRDPLAPPGSYCPGFGAYLDVMPLGGGAVQCTTQLVNYNDMDAGAGFWPGIYITGINPATGCATQGADTRGIAGAL